MIWLVLFALPAMFLALSAFCACVVGARADRLSPAHPTPLASASAPAEGYAGLPHLQPSR